jgi:hypothetical protein
MTNKIHDSFKFYESYDINGQVQSVIKYTIPKEETAGYFFIPKWAIGLGALFYIFVLTCLFAAIFVVYNAPRPGLYQESCAGRSCVKNFGLVCVNSTCTCPIGYLYIDKCTVKKTYREQCNNNNYCKDNTNLVCLNGICDCSSKQYWNNKSCSNLGSFAASCKFDSQCDDNLKLICDTTYYACGCSNTR